jgi:hypothetical protein
VEAILSAAFLGKATTLLSAKASQKQALASFVPRTTNKSKYVRNNVDCVLISPPFFHLFSSRGFSFLSASAEHNGSCCWIFITPFQKRSTVFGDIDSNGENL